MEALQRKQLRRSTVTVTSPAQDIVKERIKFRGTSSSRSLMMVS